MVEAILAAALLVSVVLNAWQLYRHVTLAASREHLVYDHAKFTMSEKHNRELVALLHEANESHRLAGVVETLQGELRERFTQMVAMRKDGFSPNPATIPGPQKESIRGDVLDVLSKYPADSRAQTYRYVLERRQQNESWDDILADIQGQKRLSPNNA